MADQPHLSKGLIRLNNELSVRGFVHGEGYVIVQSPDYLMRFFHNPSGKFIPMLVGATIDELVTILINAGCSEVELTPEEKLAMLIDLVLQCDF